MEKKSKKKYIITAVVILVIVLLLIVVGCSASCSAPADPEAPTETTTAVTEATVASTEATTEAPTEPEPTTLEETEAPTTPKESEAPTEVPANPGSTKPSGSTGGSSSGAPAETQPSEPTPPATEPPATQPPVTLPPVTQPPVTQPPVTEPPATEHTHSYGVTSTTPATCATEGSITYTCSGCGDSYSEALPMTDHTWEHHHQDEIGHQVYGCRCVCGAVFYTVEDWIAHRDSIVEEYGALEAFTNHGGHSSYSEWIVDTPARDWDECTVCGAVK